MKIAIEAQRLFRKKKHGMDIVALELIRHLQQMDRNNEYFIIVKTDEDNRTLSETENFHIVELPYAPYPIWEQYHLPKAIKKIQPDLVHCTSSTAPLRLGVPLVLTLHDILFIQRSYFARGSIYQRFGNMYRRFVVPKVIRRCEKIITVSDFEKEEIDSYFSLNNDRVKVIYNAYSKNYHQITDERILALYKEKYRLPDRYILYLGNTDPKKNIRNVLKALAKFYRHSGDFIPLVMPDVKRKYLNTILNEINEPQIGPMVHLTGYVPNNELVYVYNHASVFLYPSHYESFGIPLLEAMASGIPVISSNKAAIPEVAGDAALLVNPRDPDAIEEAIIYLLQNENKRLELKEKGLKRAFDFNWSKTAKATLELYGEIFANNPRQVENLVLQ